MNPDAEERTTQPSREGGETGTDACRPTMRVARELDLTALLNLADAFYLEGGFATTRPELARNLRSLVHADSAHVMVVELDGLSIAFAITTTTFGLESGLIAELEDLYVTPSQRHRGWAGRLVEDAAAWARQQGAGTLDVVIAPNGHDTGLLHAYYGTHDFADEGRYLLSRPLT